MVSSDSESEDDISSYGIQPYSFEPEYTEDELRERKTVRENRQPQIGIDVGDDNTDWCFCSKCVNDSSITELVCCLSPKISSDENFENKVCITETDTFKTICLNKNVLEVALESWNDLRGDNKNYKNNNYRFISYRQYILWSHGHMGKRNRVPLPVCVLKRIREVFPDPENCYIPYVDLTTAYSSFGN